MLNKARRHSPAASHITSQRALTRIFSQAQLAERLTRGSAWTLFAPTNAAFSAALDALGVSPGSLLAHKEVVDALIRLHVVPAKVPVASLRPGAELATLEGSRLPVRLSRGSSGGVDIAGAHLLRADIQATNGIIHGAHAARHCAACSVAGTHAFPRSRGRRAAPGRAARQAMCVAACYISPLLETVADASPPQSHAPCLAWCRPLAFSTRWASPTARRGTCVSVAPIAFC